MATIAKVQQNFHFGFDFEKDALHNEELRNSAQQVL